MAESGRTFLVECYLPGIDEAAVAEAGERARRVAEELLAGGREIAYLGAMFVAADEVVFHAFRASDARVVKQASRSAGLAFARVVESIGVVGDGVAAGLGQLDMAQGSGKERGR
jgi:hypothetical protein